MSDQHHHNEHNDRGEIDRIEKLEKVILKRIAKMEDKIMSVLSDLQAVVAALQTASANESSAVLAAIADINSLPASDAQLIPLTTAINAVALSTQANADALNKAVGSVVGPPKTSPTLGAITNLSTTVAGGPQTVALTGITSTAPTPTIAVVAVSSDNGAVISAPAVTYTSPAATGSLAFSPVAAGTATVTVTVSDGVGSASQSFSVTVA